jgi:NDP-sugar pyrophosphorylase family protein
MKPPTLLVLAAGMGSRYGGLKQIDPVGPHGETIMDYSIFDALRAGFEKVAFVIRKEMDEAFRRSITARFKSHVQVEYVFQELDALPPGFTVPEGRTKPWGTTQAILSAAEAIREPFAAINADDFYGAESFAVLAQHLQSGTADYAMVGFVLRNTLSEFGSVARGICRKDAQGFLESIVERTNIARDFEGVKSTSTDGSVTLFSGDEDVSMNMWGFTVRVLEQLHDVFEQFLREQGTDLRAECYLPDAVSQLVKTGLARVRVLHTHDAWFGVTYREDRPQVVESIRQLVSGGRYPERLWE